MSAKVTIVMYHYVRDLMRSTHPRIKGLDVAAFRAQLDHVQANFRVVGFDDIRRYRVERRPLPDNACWLTFDDGYSDHHTSVLPELCKRELVASFFPPARAVEEREALLVNMIHYVLASVEEPGELLPDLREAVEAEHEQGQLTTRFEDYWAEHAKPSRYDSAQVVFIKRMLQHALPEHVRRNITAKLFRKHVSEDLLAFSDLLYMTKAQLQDLLDAGMHVGSHGYDHIWLDRATPERQADEIDRSLAFLDSLSARPNGYWAMCYPYGGYNATTMELLQRRNCLAGVTTVPKVADLLTHNWLELPRIDTNDLPRG